MVEQGEKKEVGWNTSLRKKTTEEMGDPQTVPEGTHGLTMPAQFRASQKKKVPFEGGGQKPGKDRRDGQLLCQREVEETPARAPGRSGREEQPPNQSSSFVATLPQPKWKHGKSQPQQLQKKTQSANKAKREKIDDHPQAMKR